MSQISQSPNGLVSCSWHVSKKAILSALLINSKKKPYHIPQTLLFTSENNNEPSRMNYRLSTTLRIHMSFSVNFHHHLKVLVSSFQCPQKLTNECTHSAVMIQTSASFNQSSTLKPKPGFYACASSSLLQFPPVPGFQTASSVTSPAFAYFLVFKMQITALISFLQ